MTFAQMVYPGYEVPEHLRTLGDHLHAIEAGKLRRLIVTMPPRHGKSLTTSELFPAWFLARNPDKRIILSSYASTLAQRFSRSVRNLLGSSSFQAIFADTVLAKDSRSTWAWDIRGRNGGMIAAGAGSGITGHGADLLIIDDPIKDAQEASSSLIRQRLWDWYTTTAYTRLHPGGAVLVIATRWHEDDLTGRLLSHSAEDADEWTTLHFPALDENDNALWPERYPAEELLRIKASVGNRAWNALYQGAPVPFEGNMFNRAWFDIVDAIPAGCRYVRWWDKAATSKAGDWSAGVLMATNGNGVYYVVDVQRGQWSSAERNRIMVQTASIDNERANGKLSILTEQEPGSSGKESAEKTIELLAGYAAYAKSSTGSKEVRAQPLAAQCEAGNVKLMRGAWNAAYLDEMTSFPLGAHDDQVDASSGAFSSIAFGGPIQQGTVPAKLRDWTGLNA